MLLEGFVSSMTHADASKRILEEAREHHKVAGALDPLLATLANFNRSASVIFDVSLITIDLL